MRRAAAAARRGRRRPVRSSVAPNAGRTRASTSRVVVSSNERPTVVVVDPSQVDAVGRAAAITASASTPSTVTVSNHVSWRSVEAGRAQRVGGDRRHPMGPLGDPPQPVRAVVRGVEPGDVGQQHLRGADVGRRLLATDVLLARLEREPQRGATCGVGADADDAPGQGPGRRLVGGDERGVRPAEHHRHAEALRRADRDVGAELTGRRREHAGEQVGGDDREAAGGVHPLDRRPPVDDRTGRRRQAEQGTEAARRRGRRHRRRRPRCRSARRGSAARRSSADGCRGGRRSGSEPPWSSRRAIAIASAAAVASSSSEALVTGSPVSSATIVWKLSSASSRPWLISGWYGVYAVYHAGSSSTLRWMTPGVIVGE